ncbi:MAG: asparagine synthase (glutamine-hydrolyzing), partial [Methylococcaceae bacterium]|nr:asparagine synthase (glutamine-hydrolyzing) [Methylococcaceae bacterium]
FDGRGIERSDLERMNESLAHREPDGVGIWYEDFVGFGHRMLWTTPESLKEKLPFVCPARELIITADARIDNRDELAHLLALSLSVEISDSNLILAAYEKWGESCPEKLVGDFAFAIWDKRKRILFAARDRIGIKPLYYYQKSQQTFVFASEIFPLFQAAGIDKQPDRNAIEYFLATSDLQHERTLFEDIRRLPPASTLSLRDGRLTLRQYWRPSSGHDTREVDLDAHAEQLQGLLTDAVKSQMRSAYPIGCLLSGGLDSSSVLSLASRMTTGQHALSAFSMVFDKLPCDERNYIQEVINATGVEWVPSVVDGKDLDGWQTLDECYARQPEWPVQDLPASATLWPITDAARDRGIRVMLTGTGGDQVAQGSPYYLADLLSSFRFISLFRELKHYRFSRQVIRSWMLNPLIPNWVWRTQHRLKQFQGKRDDSWYLSTQDHCVWRNPYTLPKSQFANLATWHQACYVADSLLSLYLDGWWDPLGSHSQLEFRHPFFDTRVMEFLLSLPAEEKLWRGMSKIVLRQSMKGVLPEIIRERRTKAEFSPIVGLALQSMKINPGGLIMSRLGIVDSSRVEALKARNGSEPSAQWLGSLWRLARIEVWYNAHFPSPLQEIIHVQ